MSHIIQSTVELAMHRQTIGLSDYLTHADDMGEVHLSIGNLRDYVMGYTIQLSLGPGTINDYHVIHYGEASRQQGLDPISAALTQTYRDPHIGDLVDYDHQYDLFFAIAPKLISRKDVETVSLLGFRAKKFKLYHRSPIYDYYILELETVSAETFMRSAIRRYQFMY